MLAGAGPQWGKGSLSGLSLTALLSTRPGLRGLLRFGASRSSLLLRLNDHLGCAELGRNRCERRECDEPNRGGGESGTVAFAARATTDTAAAGSSQPRKLRALPPHPRPAFRTALWKSDGGTDQSDVLCRLGSGTKGS
jgi:hypothetical protein